MRKILINYANFKFKTTQKENSASGLKRGGFDQVIEYSPKDIDKNFYKKNEKILKEVRGGGYWLWKPYVILKTLKRNDLKNGEYIFYCDSGSRFIASIDPIITKLNLLEQDILAFELEHLEKKWTKKDIFLSLKAESKKFTESNQIAATNIVVKKTNFSIKFFEKLLKHSEIKHLIDDSPSQAKNYEGFMENRHDQSIFSLLYKKHHLKTISYLKYENKIFANLRISTISFLEKLSYFIEQPFLKKIKIVQATLKSRLLKKLKK